MHGQNMPTVGLSARAPSDPNRPTGNHGGNRKPPASYGLNARKDERDAVMKTGIALHYTFVKNRNQKNGASFQKQRCRKCGKLIFDGNPQMKTCDQCRALNGGTL